MRDLGGLLGALLFAAATFTLVAVIVIVDRWHGLARVTPCFDVACIVRSPP